MSKSVSDKVRETDSLDVLEALKEGVTEVLWSSVGVADGEIDSLAVGVTEALGDSETLVLGEPQLVIVGDGSSVAESDDVGVAELLPDEDISDVRDAVTEGLTSAVLVGARDSVGVPSRVSVEPTDGLGVTGGLSVALLVGDFEFVQELCPRVGDCDAFECEKDKDGESVNVNEGVLG